MSVIHALDGEEATIMIIRRFLEGSPKKRS
jgi:hypothetical protein